MLYRATDEIPLLECRLDFAQAKSNVQRSVDLSMVGLRLREVQPTLFLLTLSV